MTADKGNASIIEKAAMNAELSRLMAKQGSSGWITRIIPIGIVLLLLLLFVLQKTLHIPVFTALGLGCNRDGKDDDADCATEANYTSEQLGIARVLLLIFILGVVYFLYDIFSGGAGSAIGGVNATSPQLQMSNVVANEQAQLGMVQNSAYAQVLAARDAGGQIPQGTVDNANAPPSAPARVVAPPPAAASPTPSFNAQQPRSQNAQALVQSVMPSASGGGGGGGGFMNESMRLSG